MLCLTVMSDGDIQVGIILLTVIKPVAIFFIYRTCKITGKIERSIKLDSRYQVSCSPKVVSLPSQLKYGSQRFRLFVDEGIISDSPT